jgi:hypothetical protein
VTEGRVLEGVEIRTDAEVVHCCSCGAEMWWGRTVAGKLCPLDVVDGKHTAISHFSTCTNPKRWSRR